MKQVGIMVCFAAIGLLFYNLVKLKEARNEIDAFNTILKDKYYKETRSVFLRGI